MPPPLGLVKDQTEMEMEMFQNPPGLFFPGYLPLMDGWSMDGPWALLLYEVEIYLSKIPFLFSLPSSGKGRMASPKRMNFRKRIFSVSM